MTLQFKFIFVIYYLLFLSACVSTVDSPTQPSLEPSITPSSTIDSSSESILEPSTTLSTEVQSELKKASDNNPNLLQGEISILKAERDLEQLNEQISLQASTSALNNGQVTVDRFSYGLGPGDVLNISVFQVEELNRKTRIAGDGYIVIPLIGEVYAEGLTTSQLEEKLKAKLSESYMHDPQVSVFIEEFRSHQISVTGAVRQPNIYQIQRPQSVMEMLAMAGGLSEVAGQQVYIQQILADKETGDKRRESTVVKIDTLLTNDDPRLNILLQGGDSINVPKAGVIFVEGAVNTPGAYQIQGDMNVLKALAVAGDIKFEAKKGNVQIFRESNGTTQVIEVDIDAIKARKTEDLALLDGDIVVVPDNKFKKGWSGFWKGISGIFSVGTRI